MFIQIQKIKNDIEYYKDKPKFINLIETLTNNENIIENIINKFQDSLTEDKDYSKEINEIKKYISKFEKKYIDKINVSDGVIYEYEKIWKFYPNKKSTLIKSYYKDKFKKKDFDEIYIDNILRKEKTFTHEILNDIKNSNSCWIVVKK